jgi:hypothetical protein
VDRLTLALLASLNGNTPIHRLSAGFAQSQ